VFHWHLFFASDDRLSIRIIIRFINIYNVQSKLAPKTYQSGWC